MKLLNTPISRDLPDVIQTNNVRRDATAVGDVKGLSQDYKDVLKNTNK